MANEQVIIDIDLRLSNLEESINKVDKKFKESGKKSGESFGGGLKNAFSSLAGNLGAIAVAKSIGAITSAIGDVVSASIKIETFETRFTTLTGSAQQASQTIQDLTDFASNTPFQLEGLANSSAQLLAFGFEADDIIPKLTNIGDVAAGSGADIENLSTIFGQVSAAGKLTGERLLQLQERAIPIGAALAKTLKVPESAVRDLVSQGKVGFKEFETAFSSLSASGGIFEGGAEKLSKTLGGLLSTFNDNIFGIAADLGKAFSPIFKTVLTDAIQLIKDFAVNVRENSTTIVNNFIGLARAINDFVIAPFELVVNAVKVVGNGINAFVADTVEGFATLALKAAEIGEKFNLVDESSVQNIRTFLEASREVVDENSESFQESVNNLFKGTVYGNTEDYINKVQANVTAANEITKQLGTQVASTSQEEETSANPTDKLLGFQDIFSNVFSGFDAEVAGAKKAGEGLEQSLQGLGASAKKSLVNGLGQAASQGFASFGKALATGDNALSAFGDALLSTFGNTLIQQGTGFILQGIAQSVAGFGSGAPLIAAGAAMATFGGVLSGIGGGASASTSVSGSSADPIATTSTQESVITGEEQTAQAGNVVNLTVEGNILDRRESAIELVNIINEGVDSDNLTINQAFA